MNDEVLEKIDSALAEIRPMTHLGWAVVASLERQLIWCKNFVLGIQVEPMPGPLSMGAVAVRELDMYGDRPELAASILEIQKIVNRMLSNKNA